MVSLRRRRLLALCSGTRNPFAPFHKLFDNGNAPESDVFNSNPTSVHPMSVDVDDIKLPLEDNDTSKASGSSNISDSNNQHDGAGSNSSEEKNNQQIPEYEVKRIKQHQRRRAHKQEQSAMRGVYFKNMKWQAAIKVDKKQIHLGTVSTAEEAAHLYDRAAFMCGREPNFDLPEEEKQELQKFKWDEFLAMTRRSITCKRSRKRYGNGTEEKASTVQSSDREGGQGLSVSDDVEPDSSTSDSLFFEQKPGSDSFQG